MIWDWYVNLSWYPRAQYYCTYNTSIWWCKFALYQKIIQYVSNYILTCLTISVRKHCRRHCTVASENTVIGTVCASWNMARDTALQWRCTGRDGISNHQPHNCLLNHLFRRRSKKTSKLRVTGFCVGNSRMTGEFYAQMASNAENVSIWWRHHVWSIL